MKSLSDVIKPRNTYFTNMDTFNIITVFETNIALDCMKCENLVYFLSKCPYFDKYIIIPIVIDLKKNIGHFSALIFDKKELKVYYFDPNGCTNLYDKSQINSEILIEKLLESYIKDINIVGKTAYKFICRSVWNPYKIGMNYAEKNSIIGAGHCVVCILFMTHYLIETKCTLEMMMHDISTLYYNEIITIINNYSCWIVKRY